MGEAFLTSELLSRAGYVNAFSLRHDNPVTLLTGALGIYRARLFLANQVHGSNVVFAEGTPADVRKTDADALIARAGPTAVAVQTADCVPILVGAKDGTLAAAIHAGWRGVVGNVIHATFERLRDARATQFVAAIGPCIGKCCFEVGSDVAAQIAVASGANVIDRTGPNDKAWVDLRLAVRAQLLGEGLDDADIEDIPGCTKHEETRFYSYRREGEDAGRQIAIIRARPAMSRTDMHAVKDPR